MTTVSWEQLFFCRRAFRLGNDHVLFTRIDPTSHGSCYMNALHSPPSLAPSQRGRHYHTCLAHLRAYFAAWKPTERFPILVKLLFSVL